MIHFVESAAYDQLNYGGCSEYHGRLSACLSYPLSNPFFSAVCGLRKNKRPKVDPALSAGKQSKGRRLNTKKKLKPSEKKKNLTKKQRQSNKRRTRRGAGRKGKAEREEVVDESSKRTAVIWPWLSSITISGEVVCAGYIVSPRHGFWTTFKIVSTGD